MRVITIARKPLSEPSVAANVLKHGTGALNIDACRVGAGRWPANLILEHLPGCVRTGVRKIKPTSGGHISSMVSSTPGTHTYGDWGRTAFTIYKGADGTETVASWDCAPGCPVSDFTGETARYFKQISGSEVVKSDKGLGPSVPSPAYMDPQEVTDG